MFSKTLELSLHNAFVHAKAGRHEYITTDHLLLALLDNPEVNSLLNHCGANIERLRTNLSLYIDETTPQIPEAIEKDILPTMSFQRIIQQSIYQTKITGCDEVTGIGVLLAIMEETDSQAIYYLRQETVTQEEVIKYVTKNFPPMEDNSFDDSFFDLEINSEKQETESDIEKYAVNLNEKALNGKIDPIFGREKEIKRCVQTLARRHKNNPLLVGEAGVGKTAIAEGLALSIINDDIPLNLQGATVYSLDLGLLLAGTKYRGDFEKRLKSVLSAIGEQQNAIVFIDEIHNIIGAGASNAGSLDASNLIKPLLSSGELRCIGATTYAEFRNHFSKDSALLRRFQKIDVVEPSPEITLEILHGLKNKYEAHHNVKYSDEALERAVDLATRYLNDRHMPDKAIDIIDEAGAELTINRKKDETLHIDAQEIDAIVSEMAQIPISQLTKSERKVLQVLPQRLKKAVFDQDVAVETLVNAIKLSRSGLRDQRKPIGSFLMAGPTGVGKTEINRQLADELGIDMIRFDMSEYMEKHAVSRLIGTPPGYVGYEQGGLLTEAVIKQPHAVLLFDEIEKAHPDIFNILLQIMDYGTLTDNNGRKADFRHVIIVMTSNAGAMSMERNVIGFSETDNADESLGDVKQVFSPEFRNRLDAIIQFKHLEKPTILKIVDKNINELQLQLDEHNVKLQVTSSAKKWFAEHGYDRHMGARPMARLIQQEVKQPIADELLFGQFVDHAGNVKVHVKNGELLVESSCC